MAKRSPRLLTVRSLAGVTELRAVVPDEIAEQLASEAADRGTPAEEGAAAVMRLHVSPRSVFGSVGIGTARPGLSAREAEDRLEAEGFGWVPSSSIPDHSPAPRSAMIPITNHVPSGSIKSDRSYFPISLFLR